MITAKDVLAVFVGSTIVKIDRNCFYCSKPHIPEWRRGKIVERIRPDGHREQACHYCGRVVELVAKRKLSTSPANTEAILAVYPESDRQCLA